MKPFTQEYKYKKKTEIIIYKTENSYLEFLFPFVPSAVIGGRWPHLMTTPSSPRPDLAPEQVCLLFSLAGATQ